MLAVSHASSVALPDGRVSALSQLGRDDGRSTTCHSDRSLARGEALFRAGEARERVYRVERGALCHYMQWDNGRREIVEFAFPGDIIGFGGLERHVSTAQAMVETTVCEVSENELKEAMEIDGSLAARFAVAVDREFDFVRERAVNARERSPFDKTASLLMALSQMNSAEGRDPTVIGDEISSGVIAEQLDTTIDGLVRALRELEQRGLVSATPNGGLRITDLAGLEAVADAA